MLGFLIGQWRWVIPSIVTLTLVVSGLLALNHWKQRAVDKAITDAVRACNYAKAIDTLQKSEKRNAKIKVYRKILRNPPEREYLINELRNSKWNPKSQ